MNADFKRILDVCTERNGCPELVRLRMYIFNTEKQAMMGNPAAEDALKVLRSFRKLVDVATLN